MTYPLIKSWNGGLVVPPDLNIRGKFFYDGDKPLTIIQTSDFTLPKRFCVGQEIRPILDNRAEVGFNALRCWWLNQSVVGVEFPEGIHPDQYPDFYEKVHAFNELCGTYGFVVENTAFTSCIPLMPELSRQLTHWTMMQAAVRGLSNAMLELVNEWDWGQGQNAPHRDLWQWKPAGIISSSGSSTADAPPPEPVWDYVLYHSNGLDQWQRKVGHNCMEWADHYNKPGMSNENTRFPDQDDSIVHAYDASKAAALLTAGSCFHSQSGKYSRIFTSAEHAGAMAWVEAARSVPLEFRTGQYIRRDDLNGPQVIRAYEKRLPDGRSYIVKIAP